MAESAIDQELKAIKTIAEALEPLDPESRRRALSYAMEHLGLSEIGAGTSSRAPLQNPPDSSPPSTPSHRTVHPNIVNIRALKEQKRPNSAIEMATLVAYYLKHEAPADERKDEIGKEDVDKYFVQAGFPLPTKTAFTLPNTKNAGYLETAGHGKYKLNSVGHNLVAHNMPRTDNSAPAKPKKRAVPKKAAPQKGSAKPKKQT